MVDDRCGSTHLGTRGVSQVDDRSEGVGTWDVPLHRVFFMVGIDASTYIMTSSDND